MKHKSVLSTSYHGSMSALKKLEVFDGTEDVERFIDRFEFAATIDGIDHEKVASCLAMHLGGSAFDVWKGMENGDKNNVARIKELLRATYSVRKSAAWRALTAYRIGVGQKLDSACEELHKWAKIVIAGENPASSLAAVAFVGALPPQIAQKVRVLCGQSATREQVVAAAKDVWDDAASEVVASADWPAQRGRQTVLDARTSPRRESGKEARRCYGCGVRGHLRASCTAVCATCGGERHTERFCRKTGNELGEQ